MDTCLIISREDKTINAALVADGNLQEVFFEDNEFLSGNIYIGRVEKIVPGLNAAFIKIGPGKNAFLKLKEVTKRYLKDVLSASKISEGMKVLVQVKHDPVESKGAQVTTKIALAGRFIVYFAVTRAAGVSKKIQDESERKRLRSLIRRVSRSGSVVIRTAAEGISEDVIEEEYKVLSEKWNKIFKSFRRSRKVRVLHKEPTAIEYMLREKLNKNISEIFSNDDAILQHVRSFIKHLPSQPQLHYVEGDLFERYGIYDQLKLLAERRVDLPSGGYIAIDTTEAMTVVDVNSAAYTSEKNHADLALKINLEAAKEVARQARLRNIGGIIIVDFIDMPLKSHYDKLLQTVKQEVSRDSAKVEIIGFTKLGLLEMTRKRTAPSFTSIYFGKCPICNGSGFIMSPSIIAKRIHNDILGLEDIRNFSAIKVTLHQKLSGYVERIVRGLPQSIRKIVLFSFDGPDPGSYSVTLIKKKP